MRRTSISGLILSQTFGPLAMWIFISMMVLASIKGKAPQSLIIFNISFAVLMVFCNIVLLAIRYQVLQSSFIILIQIVMTVTLGIALYRIYKIIRQ